ncbi:MAG: FMN-binding negative transcriptional regulator [Polaromonas sp.]|uniref:FMN-binding negative transcriptional regulator n=1 Tax=Polaromonas sp. TaxID=1869339 RepID=UPI0018203BCB|nr:FMN-binding negative transcriptional regulator [Polaromonas sp.]MBA3593667.1 FMN-binding negative transcriptional regulator [Polaromonas sp.]
MYQPPQFKGQAEQAAQLIQSHPFVSLISVDDTGLPYVTHLPLHLEQRPSSGSGQPDFVLLGHVAKPNPHWRYLQARPQAHAAMKAVYAAGSPDEQALAQWMDRLGMGTVDLEI